MSTIYHLGHIFADATAAAANSDYKTGHDLITDFLPAKLADILNAVGRLAAGWFGVQLAKEVIDALRKKQPGQMLRGAGAFGLLVVMLLTPIESIAMIVGLFVAFILPIFDNVKSKFATIHLGGGITQNARLAAHLFRSRF